MGSKDILLRYKAQHKVENNFSVLKMPLLASTLFLERPERIEAMMTLLYFSVLMHGILQLISRTRIAACEEAPPLGPQNRPLIRPKSETMLNVLALFEIISKGDAVSIRSKMPERRTLSTVTHNSPILALVFPQIYLRLLHFALPRVSTLRSSAELIHDVCAP